jgi:hypothetical protein
MSYVVGPMGCGKSLFGVRRGVEAMCQGRYWLTNQRLYEDALDRMARHVARTAGRRGRARARARFEALYIYETEFDQLVKYRVRSGRREVRAVLTWDETHNDLNNRTYRDRDQSIIEWATQLRKLRICGYLLSQHHENTDAQLRRIFNWMIRLQNQRDQTRFLGLRVTPWPLFLAYWYAGHVGDLRAKVKAQKIERYFLSWHRHLYDTYDLYHGLADVDDDPNVTWLADPAEAVAAVRAGRGPGHVPGSGPPSATEPSFSPSTARHPLPGLGVPGLVDREATSYMTTPEAPGPVDRNRHR